jgi:2-polyprenyl-3-methyl-5-hydroxy-6-metoxy-1,4-benzoquinol methylase
VTRREILDIGCGDGLFFDRLAEFGNVEGVEPSAELVRDESPHRDHIHVCPFDSSFQPGKYYSLILMLNVLEHLPDPVGVPRHAIDLLAPNGAAIITVPAFMSLWTNHDVLNHHLARYTKSRFREVAAQGGLRIRSERYFFHWTCPIKLAQHGIESVFRSTPKLPQIPGPLINTMFFWLSRAEQLTLTRFSMLFGS